MDFLSLLANSQFLAFVGAFFVVSIGIIYLITRDF